MGENPAFIAAAGEVGAELARRKIALVYGGGGVGLMGALANAVLHHGGEAIGVIPRGLAAREFEHRGLTDVIEVASMHERKQYFHDLAGGFLTLAGGLGTMEEFLETLTWAQLGIHNKPCAILNTDGYFDSLLKQFDRGEREGFIKAQHHDLLLVGENPRELLDRMENWKAPRLPQWVKKGEE